MAIGNFDKIAYEDDLFYLRDTTNYRVAGTQTSSTNVWVGSLPEGIDNYYDGYQINDWQDVPLLVKKILAKR